MASRTSSRHGPRFAVVQSVLTPLWRLRPPYPSVASSAFLSPSHIQQCMYIVAMLTEVAMYIGRQQKNRDTARWHAAISSISAVIESVSFRCRPPGFSSILSIIGWVQCFIGTKRDRARGLRQSALSLLPRSPHISLLHSLFPSTLSINFGHHRLTISFLFPVHYHQDLFTV